MSVYILYNNNNNGRESTFYISTSDFVLYRYTFIVSIKHALTSSRCQLICYILSTISMYINITVMTDYILNNSNINNIILKLCHALPFTYHEKSLKILKG